MKPLNRIIAFALLSPLALVAADFEGTVTMNVTGTREQAVPINFSMKPGFTRVDMNAGGHSGGMIMDLAKREMIILMPEQKMYMVQPMRPSEGQKMDEPVAQTGDVTIEKTGEHEKILGYDTTKYIAKGKQGTSEIWVTDELGMFSGLGAGGAPGGGQRGMFGRRGGNHNASGAQGWEEAFKGKQAFPMRVITTGADGKQSKMEVTAVDKKSLPDSVFQPPADFRKFDMGAMMQGMGLPGGMRPPQGNQN